MAVILFSSCGGETGEAARKAPRLSADSPGELFTAQEPHMGTLFTIRVWSPAGSGKAIQQGTVTDLTLLTRRAFDRIAELNRIFSDYLIDSELNQLARAPVNEPIKVSDELFDILLQAESLSQKTGGAFDVTIGPMIRLWRRSRKSMQLPTPRQIELARQKIGFEKLIIDSTAKTVTKTTEGMAFDLGGIAKGYAADEALRILRKGGFPRALVAASGDIALGDSPPGETGWSVGIDTLEMASPGENRFLLANAAVSTSGDTQRFVIIGGKRYSHIVDKATGLGLTNRIAVTVVAPEAAQSDGYATAVSALGPKKGMALIESTPDVECRIVAVSDNGTAKILYSTGYPAKKR